MANTQSPFGFRSFGHRDGSAPTMGQERKFIASSDPNSYFTGDPMISNATGPYLTLATTASGTTIAGIFVGCENFNSGAGRTIWSPTFVGPVVGSTADVICWIISDPEMQFIVQTSSGTAVTSSMINSNVGYTNNVSSLGNTTTGVSAVTLVATSAALSSSLPFRIVDFYSNFAPPGTAAVNGTDNTVGGNIVVVTPNNWERKNTTAI